MTIKEQVPKVSITTQVNPESLYQHAIAINRISDLLNSPLSMPDEQAPNNYVYYSETAGKLVYKDVNGVVNELY